MTHLFSFFLYPLNNSFSPISFISCITTSNKIWITFHAHMSKLLMLESEDEGIGIPGHVLFSSNDAQRTAERVYDNRGETIYSQAIDAFFSKCITVFALVCEICWSSIKLSKSKRIMCQTEATIFICRMSLMKGFPFKW